MLNNCNYFYGRLVEIIIKRRKEIENTDNINYFDSKKFDLLTSLIVTNNTPLDSQKNVDQSFD